MAVKDITKMTAEELRELYLHDQDVMFEQIRKLTERVDSLEKQHNEDKAVIDDLSLQLEKEKAKYRLMVAARYQSQKTQVTIDYPTLFNDAELEALEVEAKENEEVITVGEHTRKAKNAKSREISYDNLDRIELKPLPVPEEERICPVCGSVMKIKKYNYEERLVVIPAKVYVEVTPVPVLECENCQSINEEGKSTYHVVSHPNPLFKGSMASSSIMGYIIDMKYNRGLPIYELEKMFKDLGVEIPRANMINWIIGLIKYLEPLYQVMKEDALKNNHLHADELCKAMHNSSYAKYNIM